MTVSSGGVLISELVGREAETETLDSVLMRLHEAGAPLVFRGEAGIGKSTLLHFARQRADELGLQVLATAGVESEAELAFAGLHQLLLPILGSRDLLPEPQRHALGAAFGITADLEPDPLHVALAAHQLISETARSSPVLLLVDDAQWLDRSTQGVLTFIARRLESESIALIAAVRLGYVTPFEEVRLESIDLGRLSVSAAAELLDRNAPDLHPVTRARVLTEAAGNPLALVELSHALSTPEGAEESLTPAAPTLTARLERAFSSRLEDLPEQTSLLLLAAALDGRASLEELVECASLLHGDAVDVGALDPAVEAQLVEIATTGLRFRHPLIRSAIRAAAPPAEVLAAYRCLATVVRDPERRLWHRARSTIGSDEALAAGLEAHAAATRRRGAVAVAAAALERSAALTADPQKKSERLVRAAEVAYELGLVDAVRRLLREAEPLELGSLEAARFAWLEQIISGDVWFESGGAKTFVTLAEQMRADGDADFALRSLVPIAHRCWWTRVRNSTRQYLVDTAQAMGVPDDDPRLLAVIALAHPEATGPSVRQRIAHLRLHDVADPIAALDAGIAADKAGDFPLAAAFLTRAVERLRDQGRLGVLTQALVHYAWVAVHTGDLETAAAAGTEAADLARDSRQPQYGLTGQLVAAISLALRGNEPGLQQLIAEPEQTLLAMKAGPMLAPAHLARGAWAVGEGRHDDAFQHLWPVFDESSSAFHRFMRWSGLLDLVEAGVHSGRGRQLSDVVTELEAVAEGSEPPFLLAGLACARPLLASDEEAEPLFITALDQDLTGLPLMRARTLFSFGRWLRKHRRRADSRAPLREGIDLFDALGASVWSERARQELRATGERIGPRSSESRDRLTAQELEIAQMAAEGLTNREIGERLFLSHRTIGSHLYRIFPKLEITSRAQLRNALAAAATTEEQSVD